jgi:hypothetical protein
MSHFAEIDNNNIVLRVLVVSNSQEHRGQDFLANDLGLGGTWIQTSYNTLGGVNINGGTPLRKNYAGYGYTYDPVLDAFIPPKPFDSWILNQDTCIWYAPTPMPVIEGKYYYWSEEDLNWQEIVLSQDEV